MTDLERVSQELRGLGYVAAGFADRIDAELARLRANQETDMNAVSECIEENIRLLAALREIQSYDTAPTSTEKGDLTDSEAFDAIQEIVSAAISEGEK